VAAALVILVIGAAVLLDNRANPAASGGPLINATSLAASAITSYSTSQSTLAPSISSRESSSASSTSVITSIIHVPEVGSQLVNLTISQTSAQQVSDLSVVISDGLTVVPPQSLFQDASTKTYCYTSGGQYQCVPFQNSLPDASVDVGSYVKIDFGGMSIPVPSDGSLQLQFLVSTTSIGSYALNFYVNGNLAASYTALTP
jgi:hypothetical protein